MQKEILLEMVNQNLLTCSYAWNRVTEENKDWRLNEGTASMGFILRHIGETINLFGYFFGVPTEVQNTTIGQIDTGKNYDTATSRALIDTGFAMLKNLVETTPDAGWLDPIDTPFFGTVSKARLFSHILYHNSHHCGQLSLTLEKGERPN
ncbi:DinB family protein [Neolewinella lacunae]|uniref:DinB family protein n=1 Tax=Neolewinella lacunae TaxID=1517758 RepID=A0A923PI28_9BACT|nr:DinB family protein [Neolewinella lacunae]MBC6993689.1 DinB family protein [Neolewinella lacunae]MDN3636384.1 DinB family protein [Neolewinella lacunae]